MVKTLKRPTFSQLRAGLYTLIFLISISLNLFFPPFEFKAQEIQADSEIPTLEDFGQLLTLQANSLLSISNPLLPKGKILVKDRLAVTLTAYSSTPEQTDSTPFVTASNSWVKDGVVANNLLPFGTKIRIPAIYGDKVFVVEDRMHWSKDGDNVDIWFPSYWEAKNFGVKRSYIEILKI